MECDVVDTGMGIAPQEQEKVFERFYRTSSAYRGQYTGFGIGLHIVQQFVSLLQGNINLESTLGKGTTFKVSLPVLLDSSKTKENAKVHAQPIEKSAQPITSRPLILLIEDNPIALKILEVVVGQAQCDFFSAKSGEEALILLQKFPFHFIITDLGLPGMSGHGFASAVRTLEQKEHKQQIPIIGLTAHRVIDTEATCLKIGMNKVITKPIKLEVLQQLLHEFVYKVSEEQFAIKQPLGKDLPPNPAELFQLTQYPLLDAENGLRNLGSTKLFKELLSLMIDQALPEDGHDLEQAYAEENWPLVEKIAHKIKSGTLYCGTVRLKFASQYLERYHQAGHRSQLENLYQQLIQIIEQTKIAIRQWLIDSP
jgi:CheY-like chemotaxis protein